MTDIDVGADANKKDADAPTWRAPLNRLEFATIKVHDLDANLDWYTRALDLEILDRTAERALLTCGGDYNVDLALVVDRDRGKGLESYSFGIDSLDALDSLAEEFTDRGTRFERLNAGLRGIDGGISIVSPTGAKFEIVASGERVTGRQNPGRNNGVAPVDTDHMNLLAPDVKGYAQWLHDTFGFETSDAVALPQSNWMAAWTHITPQHHDVAIITTSDPATKLHHVAFLAEDLNHMGEVADRVCSIGVERCEWGIGKHGGLGDNNFLYMKDPSGNRIEVNSGMADNPYERPTDIYTAEEFESFISVWDFVAPPAGFELGS